MYLGKSVESILDILFTFGLLNAGMSQLLEIEHRSITQFSLNSVRELCI